MRVLQQELFWEDGHCKVCRAKAGGPKLTSESIHSKAGKAASLEFAERRVESGISRKTLTEFLFGQQEFS